MRIGIFDSGIGGLTVLKEILAVLPDAEYIYFADSYHAPYGTKTKEQVKGLVFDVVAFLDAQHIDALVIACNTATSIGVADLRIRYGFPIIGMEPAVKYALEHSDSKRVLVLATPLTLKEEKYHKLLSRVDVTSRVDSLPLPKLVKFAEEGQFDHQLIENYLNNQLEGFDFNDYSSVVLGCTHFIYYKKYFKNILPLNTTIYDGNKGTANQLLKVTSKIRPNIDNEASATLTETKSARPITYYQSNKYGVEEVDFSHYLKVLNQV